MAAFVALLSVFQFVVDQLWPRRIYFAVRLCVWSFGQENSFKKGFWAKCWLRSGLQFLIWAQIWIK